MTHTVGTGASSYIHQIINKNFVLMLLWPALEGTTFTLLLE